MATIRSAGRWIALSLVAMGVMVCLVTEGRAKPPDVELTRPSFSGYYRDAYLQFQKAQAMPTGPARTKALREVGALYKTALEKAPARDEAPEAAIVGAHCFKQVGDYDQAIGMYRLFIEEYGRETVLARLMKGDPTASPPRMPDAQKYQERIKYTKQVYDALGRAQVLFFDYGGAAETFMTISGVRHFTEPDRREAARNAVVLYANLGDKAKTLAARTRLFELSPTAEEKAEMDFLIAKKTLEAWNLRGADEGDNKKARLEALTAMEALYGAYKASPPAAMYGLRAAYHAFKLRLAVKDSKARDWAKKTTEAFEKHKAGAAIVDGRNKAVGSAEADMAAEAAYWLIDEQLRREFDYETGHHRYEGYVDKVTKAFDEDLKKASDKHWRALQKVIDDYQSREWSVAARARQGSLYDSIRTGLYNARAPALKLYTPAEERIINLAERIDSVDPTDLQMQAEEIREKARSRWRAARQQRLDEADRAMVKAYVDTVSWAKAWNVHRAAVDSAMRRLAFYTDVLGDDRLRALSKDITDPATKQPFRYVNGMFVSRRRGAAPSMTASGVAPPVPAGARR